MLTSQCLAFNVCPRCEARQGWKPQLSKTAHSCSPVTNLPTSIKYDGHLTCSLMRNHTDPFPEPLPPGTHVTITHNNKLPCGTIQRVPVFTSTLVHSAATTAVVSSLHPSVPSTAYTLQLNEGGTTNCAFKDLVRVSKSTVSTDGPAPLNPFAPLPYFLKFNAKLIMDHNGSFHFHKGYPQHFPEWGF